MKITSFMVDFFPLTGKKRENGKNPSFDKLLTLAQINMVCALQRIMSRFILNVLIQAY